MSHASPVDLDAVAIRRLRSTLANQNVGLPTEIVESRRRRTSGNRAGDGQERLAGPLFGPERAAAIPAAPVTTRFASGRYAACGSTLSVVGAPGVGPA